MQTWQRVYGDLRYLQSERERLARRYANNPNLTLEVALGQCDELISERQTYLEERK